ncbi:unnamed protein product, partial [Prorocentrum cordatum]
MGANSDCLYRATEDHEVQEGAVTTAYGKWVSAVESATLAAPKTANKDGKRRQTCAKEPQAEAHHLQDMGRGEVFGARIAKSEKEDYYLQLDAMENSTVDKLKDFFNAAGRHDTVAQARGLTAQRQQFTPWAMQMRSSKPGALPRHVKDKAETRFELAINLE